MRHSELPLAAYAPFAAFALTAQFRGSKGAPLASCMSHQTATVRSATELFVQTCKLARRKSAAAVALPDKHRVPL